MKKVLSVVLSIFMICTVFSGCSSVNTEMTEENINATVAEAFDALKSFDTKKLGKFVESSTLSMIISYAEKYDQFKKLGVEMFKNLTYEIKSVDIENETVTVSVKNKDLKYAAAEFAKNLKSKYNTVQLLTKLSDENFLDTNLTSLCEKINNAVLSDESTEITLSIEKGSKNLVLFFDGSCEDAVSGGALGAIKSIYGLG